MTPPNPGLELIARLRQVQAAVRQAHLRKEKEQRIITTALNLQ